MARIISDDQSGHSGNHAPESSDDHLTVINAQGHTRIDLPEGDFLSKGDIAREGQDLILRTSDGHEVMVEDYFSATPMPDLTTVQGSTLTPALVESFVKIDGPIMHAANGTDNDASPVGLVKEVSGEATVTRTDGTTDTITLGTEIYQGDIVETAAEGAVNIVFIDESSFSVSNNARMAIDEYVFDPASQSGETNVSILRGMFVFTSGLIGRDDPDDVQIDTPIGSIGIRGTTIAGHIQPDGQSQITVVEGAIVIRNNITEITLADQYETVRLGGMDSQIELVGQLNPDQMRSDYSGVQTVNPGFFNTMNPSPDPVNAPAPGEAPAPAMAPESPMEGTIPHAPAPNMELQRDGSAVPAGEPGQNVDLAAASEEGTPDQPKPAEAYDMFSDPAKTGFDQSVQFRPGDPYAPGAHDGFAQGPAGSGAYYMPPPNPAFMPPPNPNGPHEMAMDPNAGTPPHVLPPLELIVDVRVDDDSIEGDIVGVAFTTLDYPGANMQFLSVPDYIGSPAFELMWMGPGVYAIVLTAAGETLIGGMSLGDLIGNIVVGVRLADGRQDAASFESHLGDYDMLALPSPLDLDSLSPNDGYDIDGPSATGKGMGNSSAFLGDFDRNGSLDFALSTRTGPLGTIFIDGGSAADSIVSGFDTSNMVVAGGYDINGDGKTDMVSGHLYSDLGAPDAGRVIAYSGATGMSVGGGGNGPSASSYLGSSVALLDFNGDGYGDVVAGAMGANSGDGQVRMFQGFSGHSFTGLPMTTFVNGAAASFSQLGLSMTALGDYNNDGFGDFAVGGDGPGLSDGFVRVYIGNATGTVGTSVLVSGLSVDGNELPIASLGDINGDGKTDLLIGETGFNADGDGVLEGAARISFGGSGGTIGLSILSDPNEELTGGGAAGDFNGDGFDDIFIATRNGDIVDAYVIYGAAGIGGTITLDPSWMVNNPDKGFHMTIDLNNHLSDPVNDPFSLSSISIGDQDGDGFGDILISSPELNDDDGGYFVVYGRPSDDQIVNEKIHIANWTSPDDNAFANSMGDSVVGDNANNNLYNNGWGNVSFSGGSGNDNMFIDNGMVRSLDGGLGIDTAILTSSGLNLENISHLSGIERFMFDSGADQTMTIGLSDVFSLMQGSDDFSGGKYRLWFTENTDASVETLNINNPDVQTGILTSGNTTLQTQLGLTYDGVISGHDAYNFGSGYQLLIDQNITVNVV